ncbi:MAG: preprotein translocase subunit SecE [Candidatus Vogelbacteria bacterium]|nr:preprotein translocase subunit SecE [Candidatus Vogelbacteria bacterium]
MGRLINYFKDTRSEMNHVSWPSREQTINFTIIVLGFSVLVGLLLGVFDFAFSFILKSFILK